MGVARAAPLPPIPRYLDTVAIKHTKIASQITARTITTLEGLDGLKHEWRILEAAAASNNNCFQSFDWCDAWARTHCSSTNIKPHIVAVYHGNRLALIWPLMMTCIGPFCVLRWLSDPFGQYGDVIARPGHDLETYLATAWQEICENSQAATVRLRHVREDAVTFSFLKQHCSTAGRPECAPYLDLTNFASEAAYNQRYNRTQRRRRKRIHKELTKFGEIKFTQLTGPGHLDEIIDQIILQKNIWLHRRGHFSEALASRHCAAFLKNLASRTDSPLRVVTSVLTAGKRAVSYEIGLRFNAQHMCFITAHDNQLTDFSPGRLLMDFSQRQALREGLAVFDLMVPGDDHKRSWSSDAVKVTDFYVALNVRGKLFGHGFLKTARPILRRLYHSMPIKMRRRLIPLFTLGVACQKPKNALASSYNIHA